MQARPCGIGHRKPSACLGFTFLFPVSLMPTPTATSSAVFAPARTGNGAWTCQSVPGWGALPAGETWQPTHGAIVTDKAGHVYASTDGPSGLVVLGADGSFLKSFKDVPTLHDMQLREETESGAPVECIYAIHLAGRQMLKMNAQTGEVMMTLRAPKAEYPGEADWRCTGVAVAPDGAIFVSDGYGNSRIHKFDAQGRHLLSFAGKGEADGLCNNCHTCAVDLRSGQPLLLVVDRENRRLSHFDLEGNFIRHLVGHLRRPCAVAFASDNRHVAVAELEGRVTILDEHNAPVAFLGDNPDRSQWANFNVPPQAWREALFTAPHGVCFDAKGDLLVMDWNANGRLSRLVRV